MCANSTLVEINLL